ETASACLLSEQHKKAAQPGQGRPAAGCAACDLPVELVLVFEVVPDVLDIVVILQRVKQLGHVGHLVGVAEGGGAGGHLCDIRRNKLISLFLLRVADGGEIVGGGGPFGGILPGVKYLGAGVKRLHHT